MEQILRSQSGISTRSPPAPLKKATVYTHLPINLKILHFAPLAPQVWGEPELQSPPELGDLGGKIASFSNQRTCVYTVALKRGENPLKVPLFKGDLGGSKFLYK
jgi:hypothetical protein